MNLFASKSHSDNRKSKTFAELNRRIENRKLMGFLAFLIVLVG